MVEELESGVEAVVIQFAYVTDILEDQNAPVVYVGVTGKMATMFMPRRCQYY